MTFFISAVVQDGASVVTTLTETEIVAQAITELQQVCAPVNIAGESTTLVCTVCVISLSDQEALLWR